MRTGVTCAGYGWIALSLLAASVACAAFFIPVWLVGVVQLGDEERVATSFGAFRRCNFPVVDARTGRVRVAHACGRYSSFGDIPSLWWRITTVAVAVGCAVALLCALVSLPACLCSDIVSRTSARLLGVFQAVAGVLILTGCLLYPLGWDNREVSGSCGGKTAAYNPGSCAIGWAYYMILGAAALLLVCASLSVVAGKPVAWKKLSTKADDAPSTLTTINI